MLRKRWGMIFYCKIGKDLERRDRYAKRKRELWKEKGEGKMKKKIIF